MSLLKLAGVSDTPVWYDTVCVHYAHCASHWINAAHDDIRRIHTTGRRKANGYRSLRVPLHPKVEVIRVVCIRCNPEKKTCTVRDKMFKEKNIKLNIKLNNLIDVRNTLYGMFTGFLPTLLI